ncbi:MAG TPA: hypothetical protein VF263_05585 [Longimicrobiaceae bacterium]
MTVRVDSLTTEVSAEPAGSAERAREGSDWKEREQVAAAQARVARDELRTRASGYDD